MATPGDIRFKALLDRTSAAEELTQGPSGRRAALDLLQRDERKRSDDLADPERKSSMDQANDVNTQIAQDRHAGRMLRQARRQAIKRGDYLGAFKIEKEAFDLGIEGVGGLSGSSLRKPGQSEAIARSRIAMAQEGARQNAAIQEMTGGPNPAGAQNPLPPNPEEEEEEDDDLFSMTKGTPAGSSKATPLALTLGSATTRRASFFPQIS